MWMKSFMQSLIISMIALGIYISLGYQLHFGTWLLACGIFFIDNWVTEFRKANAK